MSNKNKAIFLDRDGVINKDEDYVYRCDDFVFIEDVFLATLALQRAGFKIIIITNQAGIGRGYYTEEDFARLTDWMVAEFKRNGVVIDGVYYCPHHPMHGQGRYLQSCLCRKPEPGLLLQAITDHDIEVSDSVLVGDKLSDIQAGRAAGVGRCYFVRTGKSISDKDANLADAVFDNLLQVADFITN